MESARILVRREPFPPLIQNINFGGDGQYMYVVSQTAKNLYVYDLATSFPHTLVTTISLASMSSVAAICYRSANDSVYICGSNQVGIVSNASSPLSSALTVISTDINVNSTSNAAGFTYDYRRDLIYNLDGNGGTLKIFDPNSNAMLAPTGWNEGFGSGSLYYAGDIEKMCIAGGTMFGMWAADLGHMIFGRVGSGVTAGGRDAVYVNGSLYIASASTNLVKTVLVGTELRFVATLNLTQLVRSLAYDFVNNKIVCACNADTAGQNLHFKFVDPVAFTLSSSPTIAEVSDERQTNSLKFSEYNQTLYTTTRQITGGNPSRLIRVDAATETILGATDLPSNLGTGITANEHLICFNRIEL